MVFGFVFLIRSIEVIQVTGAFSGECQLTVYKHTLYTPASGSPSSLVNPSIIQCSDISISVWYFPYYRRPLSLAWLITMVTESFVCVCISDNTHCHPLSITRHCDTVV